MSAEPLTYFAKSWFNERALIGIPERARRLHFLAVGGSGCGKSTLLAKLMQEDLRHGRGFCLLDPHGDLAQSVLQWVPSKRRKRVIYVNPMDVEFPPGINILEKTRDKQERHLAVDNMMTIFQKFWAHSWGERMAYILRNCLLTLMENPGSTLIGVNKLLTEPEFRSSLLRNVNDGVVQRFWQNEYELWPERFRVEAIAPIQNKIGQLLSGEILRNILCQSRGNINFEEVIRDKYILVVNLSKGISGSGTANLLGSIILSKVIMAGLKRAKLPENERDNFYIYCDEYHNFIYSAEMFKIALSEARKYGICLVLANQYLNQVEESVRDAILANVGTFAVFRVDGEDALRLGRKFGADWPWQQLTTQKQFEFHCLLTNRPEKPLNCQTIIPMKIKHTADIRLILRASRQRFRSRQRVERAVNHYIRTKVWPRYN